MHTGPDSKETREVDVVVIIITTSFAICVNSSIKCRQIPQNYWKHQSKETAKHNEFGAFPLQQGFH